jgi:hypothetical protein
MSSNSAQKSLTRRGAIKTVGAAAVAATMAPNILVAGSEKKTSKVLGADAHTYEWVDGWGQLPASVEYGTTHGIAEDSHGRIYVHNMSKHGMIVFDPDGKFIESWGEEFEGGAHGITVSKEGGDEFLYLSDMGRRILVKTTLDGEVVWTQEFPKEPGLYKDIQEYRPTEVAVAPNGDFYVADGYGSHYIHQYDKDAKYIRTWGGQGTEDGQFKTPHGISLDTRSGSPLLAVCDRANARIQYFDLEGNFVRKFSAELLFPCHTDTRGEDVLVSDLYGRVAIYDKDDQPTHLLGDNPGVNKAEGYPNLKEIQEVGKFISPHCGIWDREGNIYIAEWINTGRVTKLKHVT